MFTDRDLTRLRQRGITLEEAADQMRVLQQAPRPIVLDRPCTAGDGIVRFDAASQHDELRQAGQRAAAEGRVQKFVPASGAATRMFKDLIAALASNEQPSAAPAARAFFDRLDDYPFAEPLRRRANISGAMASADDERTILRTLLEDMRYAELPKALIPFHRRPVLRTAFEEQLLEGVRYTRSRDGIARTHFTVAPEFREDFDRLLAKVAPRVRAATEHTTLAVSFSEQHPSTDTLAATLDGEPFRTSDGTLLVRPAGHGALLRNLQALEGDLVVIKNIDNVLPFERSDEVVRWKQLLLGYLVSHHAGSDDERPLRVCGVVKNEGEPGGAPFWIVHEDGRRSMQIVEASQVDLEDPAQRRIFESSTHFNPVDIVCALRSKDGRPFDLHGFVDPSAVFLSRKSHEGQELVALERPGLWNGAMAWWHTVFIEVPASTFAPVKTVFDLLRPEHQSL